MQEGDWVLLFQPNMHQDHLIVRYDYVGFVWPGINVMPIKWEFILGLLVVGIKPIWMLVYTFLVFGKSIWIGWSLKAGNDTGHHDSYHSHDKIENKQTLLKTTKKQHRYKLSSILLWNYCFSTLSCCWHLEELSWPKIFFPRIYKQEVLPPSSAASLLTSLVLVLV